MRIISMILLAIIVFGIGSYTYQFNTRDTFGFAMKATFGEVNGEAREIFKDPITDDGTKKSKKGLLMVGQRTALDNSIYVKDQVSWEEESTGLLQTAFEDGKILTTATLNEIRKTLGTF